MWGNMDTPDISISSATSPDESELIDGQIHFLWHHRCHEVWAKERLHFWRLAFSPTYDSREVLTRVRTVMFDKRVMSYALYELTGEFDLMLRVWLPATVTHDDFQTSLERAFGEFRSARCDSFAVQKIVAHWVWDRHGTAVMKHPDDDILKTGLTDADIQRVNDGQITREEFNWYEEKGLVAHCSPSSGIKFVVRIPSADDMSVYARNRMRTALKEVLVRASHISDISLYCGAGFAGFLLMGRIDSEHFHELNGELVQPVNELGLGDFFGVRTYSHIILASPVGSQTLQDRLPLKDELDTNRERSVEEYLVEDEATKLEFKASAFVNMDRLLFGDGKRMEDREVTKGGVLKAIVGMLNSKGGNVIVGVYEAKQMKRQTEQIKAMPRRGAYVVCGVDEDMGGKDWDAFGLRLCEVIYAGITPSVRPWVRLHKETVDGRHLCVVEVRAPRTDWFYLKDDPRFIVRIGNNTRELAGPDADAHKRSEPR